jgi:antirestriction protein
VTKCDHCDGTGEAPTAEEWAVHDYEGFGPIKLGEHPDLDTVAEVAEVAAALDEHGEAYAVWYSNESRDGAEVDTFQEQYRGTYRTLGDWAEEFLEETGSLADVPASLRNYIDFDAWARDAEMSGDIWSVDGGDGVYVFDNH